MEPYTGCNNTRQCLINGYTLSIMGFILGIVVLSIDSYVAAILIGSSVGLCLLTMGLAILRTCIIQRQEERIRKHTQRTVVNYYRHSPPIVIVQPDNTYYVGTRIDEHPHPIYTTIPIYVATI